MRRIGSPPAAGTSQIELGARFANVGYSGFPETKAIHLPSGDHAGEWDWPALTTTRGVSASRLRT